MRPELNFLDECLRTLRSLRQGHTPVLQSPVMDVSDAHLDLGNIHSQPFLLALRERPISSGVQDALVSMYERILEQLKHMYTEHFHDAQVRWGSARQRALPQIQRLFEVQCRMAARDMHDAILALVDERLKMFAADANAPHESHRPHSAHAIAILERAFEHAPNITQAEKYKLAQATGLQPRQVTIWFQNRRNRRTNARRTAPAFETEFAAPKTEPPPPPPPVRLNPPPPPSAVHAAKDETIVKCEEAASSVAEWTSAVPSDSFSLASEALHGSPFAPNAIQGAQGGATAAPVPPAPPLLPAAPALSLDQLLDMDNAQQCLVFSPLDSLPRLDFEDLRLDVPTIENWLGMPSTPGVSSLHVPPMSANATRAAEMALAHTLNTPDELMSRAADEGWTLGDQIALLWNAPPQAGSVQPSHPPTVHGRSDIAVRLDGNMMRRDSAIKLERAAAPPPSAPLISTPYQAPSSISGASPLPGRWAYDAIAPSMLTCDYSRVFSSTLVP